MSGGPPPNYYGFTTPGPLYNPGGLYPGPPPTYFPSAPFPGVPGVPGAPSTFVHTVHHVPLSTTVTNHYPSGETNFTSSFVSSSLSHNITSGPQWVHWHKDNMLPAYAVQAGHDIDGSKIYVGRLQHKGDLLPAKVIPQKRVAYVSYNGIEIPYHSCEILCHEHVRWIRSSHGNVPPGATAVGRTSSGETLYAARMHHNGSLTVGKVHPSHRVCYIPFDGKEVSHYDYEVLIL